MKLGKMHHELWLQGETLMNSRVNFERAKHVDQERS